MLWRDFVHSYQYKHLYGDGALAMLEAFVRWFSSSADDLGDSPVSIAEIPHLLERSASRLC